MPAPSRWLIRSSFGCLLVGMIIGALLLIHKSYPLHPAMWSLLPVHIELLIFGWIIQFTMGTAYWILPRYLEDSSRGNPALVNLTVVLLNMGILLMITDTLLLPKWPLALAGRAFEAGAVLLFIMLHWRRIVSYQR
ncbi:cbb3-type cytochrome c oxidase subunit I [Aliifodinibius sp. S!AR15-10]|uniref:cbb3-type cytochrome c oxidase subunit I n=1 Tax=Aliifodinibius sp. S!AR15-10 TaxID=2950437 RepID=UPI00285A1FDB|nr:cbb3-type cytochrome c oxidase subunit I [Aliifodinibius sp. S!AR15-10]MDR8390679.1 cbb3-type cytochrome c oxidase subunit I [Aliifodinibius sp. S!AR15-10]